MSGRPWTAPERELALAVIEQGNGSVTGRCAAAAARLGRSARAVERWHDRWRRLGASQYRPGPRRRWTAEQEMIVVRDIDRLRLETIAARIGKTPTAVRRWCERQGVYPTTSGLLTSQDAADRTGIAPHALTRMARRRIVRAHRVPGGTRWLFYPESLPVRSR